MARKLERSVDEGLGGFPHYMLKEIHEQPHVIQNCMAGRVEGTRVAEEVGIDEKIARSIQRIELVACGTSWHAALIGRRLMEDLLGIPTTADIASEYREWPRRQREGTLVLTITQSGETSDTLAALRSAKKVGHRTATICNVEGSTIARESDGVLYTKAGTEVSIASTKAFSCQVAALFLLTMGLGRLRGMDSKRDAMLSKALVDAPERISKILPGANSLAKEIANEQKWAESVFYLGRGYGYPVALEGALKLKETSYVHAEGYPAGEFRHGPIALISSNVPVVALAPKDALREKNLANMEEIRAKGGTVIALGTEKDAAVARAAHRIFTIPEVPEELFPLYAAVPLQLLAYNIAVAKGREVDQPRNLSKSVMGD